MLELANKEEQKKLKVRKKYPDQFPKNAVQWYKSSDTDNLVHDCFDFVRYLAGQSKLEINELLTKNQIFLGNQFNIPINFDKNIGVLRILILHFLMQYPLEFKKWKSNQSN